MNWLDIAIIAIILLSSLISFNKGFTKESLSLIIWIGSFFIATTYYPILAPYITAIEDEIFKHGAAIAILFIATLLVGSLINSIISKLINNTGLSGTDKILGVIFGAFRGILIISATLFMLDSFTGAPETTWWQESKILPEFGRIINPMFDYLKANSSFISTES